MNRDTRRSSDRGGRTGDDGAVGVVELDGRDRARGGTPRTSPVQFAREVRDELRQVAWPNRTEMVNYTMVVFFTLVLMVALIFLLNYGFGRAVLFIFQK